MKREEIEKVVKLCQDELLIHLNAMMFAGSDYPVRAVSQSTLLSLPALLRTQIDKLLSEQNEKPDGQVQLEQRVSPHECLWKYSNEPDEDVWETSCGQLFMLSNENTPSENGFRFCCYCGNKLVSG